MFSMKSQEGAESIEKGKNVLIRLKFIRHGERDKEGRLTDYGRDVTVRIAKAHAEEAKEFDVVKAIGSDAGEKNGFGKRAFETADLYAKEVAGDEVLRSKVQSVLSYETIISPVPHDYQKLYNDSLPVNFDELSPEEKSAAARVAQRAMLDHLVASDTPEAEAYKREEAGAFAYLVEHYRDMAKRLKDGSKVLIPAGTHGGTMEFLLQQALVRKNDDGSTIVGFKKLDEIGGEFSPSEDYNVDVSTDENGHPAPMRVSFDNPFNNPGRVLPEVAYLDEAIVAELADYYRKLHFSNTE
jgi:broad specificity phosphatase PhoE